MSIQETFRTLNVDDGRLFRENYLRMNPTYPLGGRSFVRFAASDDLFKRNPDLYLYDDADEKTRETTMELLFAWKPSQGNTFFIGVQGIAEDDDEIRDLTFSEYTFYVKYARPLSL